jgi:hypothetical protein
MVDTSILTPGCWRKERKGLDEDVATYLTMLTPGWSMERQRLEQDAERQRLEQDAAKIRPISSYLTSSDDIGKIQKMRVLGPEGANKQGQRITPESVLGHQGQRITEESVLRHQSRRPYHAVVGEAMHWEPAKLAQLHNPDAHAGLQSKVPCSNPAYENRLAQILLLRHKECSRKRQQRQLAQKQLQTAQMQADFMALFTECKKSGSVNGAGELAELLGLKQTAVRSGHVLADAKERGAFSTKQQPLLSAYTNNIDEDTARNVERIINTSSVNNTHILQHAQLHELLQTAILSGHVVLVGAEEKAEEKWDSAPQKCYTSGNVTKSQLI